MKLFAKITLLLAIMIGAAWAHSMDVKHSFGEAQSICKASLQQSEDLEARIISDNEILASSNSEKPSDKLKPVAIEIAQLQAKHDALESSVDHNCR